jgi:hypothetical protein
VTGPIVHEMTTTVSITDDEAFFDVALYTKRWIARELLHRTPCLEAHEKPVSITEGWNAKFSLRTYTAKALCPHPDTCSTIRKTQP